MLLSEFFKNAPDIKIEQISCDSRMPMRNSLFFCIKGISYNGHDYVNEAVKNGAVAIVYDRELENVDLPVVFIRVQNSVAALNAAASLFYGDPSKSLENIVVGGIRSRSLLTYSIKKAIDTFRPCGYIGSLGISYNDNEFLSKTPTLTIIENQRTLDMMVKDNVLSCCFELDYSSIELKKLQGIHTNAFVFSGIDEDKREYQNNESDYLPAYCNYVQSLPENTDIILNIDDVSYNDLLQAAGHRNTASFGFSEEAKYRANDIQIGKKGTSFTLSTGNQNYLISVPLIGAHIVLPITGMIACMAERGYPLDEVVDKISSMKFPGGISEPINDGQNYQVIIDRATTPSSLRDILDYSSKSIDRQHRIVAVYGISARMDAQHKIRAAAYFEQTCDELILTENDAADKDQTQLNESFAARLESLPVLFVENREEAIRCAVDIMGKGDCLLLFGKGSDKYLLRSLGKDYYIGDKECVKRAIRARMEEEL